MGLLSFLICMGLSGVKYGPHRLKLIISLSKCRGNNM